MPPIFQPASGEYYRLTEEQLTDVMALARKQIVSRTDMHNSGLSNGIDTDANVRAEHQASPDYTTGEIQLVYGNYPVGLIAATGPFGTGDLTLRASIEYPAGTFYPVFFNGSRDAVIQPGAQVVSDTVGITIPAGAVFWTRAFVQVTAGDKWPLGYITKNTDLGVTRSGWYVKGTGLTDQTTSGTNTDNFTWGFSPIAVIGKTIDGAIPVAVGLIGDSLMHASSPSSAALGNYNLSAYTEALYGQLPFIQAAQGGAAIAHPMRNPYLLATIGKYTTHVICNLGVNDFRGGASLAQMQSQLLTLWEYFTARGIKVYQATITPETTSTDGWVTTANQTKSVHDAKRTALNDWIRATPAPLTGYIEIADLSETSRNSGIWPAAVTSDGLHPRGDTLPAGATLLNAWKAAVAAKIPEMKV